MAKALRIATVIQVGNLLYESSQFHKELAVGRDYPVVIEVDNQGNAKRLILDVGGKAYTYLEAVA